MTALFRAPSLERAGGPKPTTTQAGSTATVGVVTTVDHATGELTLVLRGGAWLLHAAHPRLLQEVRPWKVVQVVTEGTVIRALRCV
jgi:hypothetical protein